VSVLEKQKERCVAFAIQTRDLTKQFPKPGRLAGLPFPFVREKGTLAVDRVDLSIRRGEVFGLVGPNGAGKTTLVKMLATLILPTSGSAQVGGYELCEANERRIRTSIGLVAGNERGFYPRLSCRENLQFYAGLHDLSATHAERRIAELSHLLELADFLDKRYDTCSTGMKHRLALARGLLNAPTLLFLDEPTRSLDPLAAARFRQAIYTSARGEGRTVFLVTHDLGEAAELCDRVGVMLEGRLRVVDAPQDLPRLLRPRTACTIDIRAFTGTLGEALRKVEGVSELTEDQAVAGVTSVRLCLHDRNHALPGVMQAVAECGGAVEGLTFEAPSWEEVFHSLAESWPAEPVAGAGPQVRLPAPPAAPLTAVPSLAGRQAQAVQVKGLQSSALAALAHLFRKPLLFVRRDLRTQMSYRLSFLLQVLGILFSSASFYFVAQLLGSTAASRLGRYGGDYFGFVLIGIAFVGYQGVALHAFSGVIRSAQSLGTLEAMLVTPTRLSTVLVSSSLWNFGFTSLRVVIYLLAGVLVFGADLRGANLLAGLVVLLLTILTLSSIGVLSASFIMVFKRGSPINFLIGSLSSLLGGVYYPLEVLPGWLRTVARVFPLTYSLEAMRRALLAGEGIAKLGQELAVLSGFSIALLPLSLIAFRQAVRQAKRDGSLTHF
jgi:ABC-2 type transport system permease protein